MIALLSCPPPAIAGYGLYTHGYGIKSLGYGGIGYVLAEDSYTLASNPAGAAVMGDRLDLGLDYENFDGGVSIEHNLLGRDQRYVTSQRDFIIPQIGATWMLSDRVVVGATAFFAGFGTEYKHSPYERFGGDPSIKLGLSQASAALALGYLIAPHQSVGFAVNLAYQVLEAEGADVFAALSDDRKHFSNQGMDGRFGAGFTLGWLGTLGPQVVGALSYRSKTWTDRYDEYAGLLPERGRVDLPAIYGGGLSWAFIPGWTAAFEYQRIDYGEEAAIGNRLGHIIGGESLGLEDGPGFGWRNQDITKFGLAFEVSERLTLRGGYGHGSQNIPTSQTFFGGLAPSFLQDHYTLGATLGLSPRWEVSGYLGIAPRAHLYGKNSIPPVVGGGEANLDAQQFYLGFSFGRRTRE